MSYKGPRAKKSRALGVALTTKAAAVMIRKPHPPGQHGQGRRRSKSDYALQLLEKQKLRFQYNVSEKHLRKYFATAKRKKGNTGENLLKILESRLDNIVYRAGLAPTIYSARQLVSHGHILVNGGRVNIPSFLVSLEDTVSVREKSKNLLIINDARSKANLPPYISSDAKSMVVRLEREPTIEEIPVICEVQMGCGVIL